MKKKAIIGLFIGLLGYGTMATSCEDMLTPEMDRYAENFTGKDTVNFYLGIMANLQEMIEQNVILGEIRGDLTTTTQYTSDSISNIANFTNLEDGENELLNRAAYYKVINQCNFYLSRVDSLAQKNNIRYMQKETAQVMLIRAWTYMQLVQNYGRVPFVTEPVDNANTGWETNPPKGWADADNLVDLLQGDLKQALSYELSYGYPNYGSFNTGAVSVGHANTMIFPANLIIGDLYLLRGRDQSDYENAAKYYYDYLVSSNVAKMASRSASVGERTMSSGETSYTYYPSSWLSGTFTGLNYAPSTRTFVAIPSAANTSFGKVLTRIPQVYGFDIHSTNTTTTTEGDDGESSVSTDGQITVTPNIRTRQIAPSRAYETLNAAQLYKSVRLGATDLPTSIEYYEGAGDGRIAGSAPYYRTDEGVVRFIQKFCASTSISSDGVANGSFAFRYIIPVYRTEQVYLRFAEAINRAGFPHYAFAILRDGLNRSLFPTLGDSVMKVVNASGDTIYKRVAYIDSIDNGINYLTVDEMRRAAEKPWLDFSGTAWTNVGIHAMGCGTSYAIDTLYTYDKVIAERMAQEESRNSALAALKSTTTSLFSKVKTDETEDSDMDDGSEGEGGDTDVPGKTPENPLPLDEPQGPALAEINAMETLIADEMGLETAFEGFRYYDLMRIARHKNNVNGGSDGSMWLAWLISRRTLNLAPYEEPLQTGTLYNFLLSPANWYLPNPEY